MDHVRAHERAKRPPEGFQLCSAYPGLRLTGNCHETLYHGEGLHNGTQQHNSAEMHGIAAPLHATQGIQGTQVCFLGSAAAMLYGTHLLAVCIHLFGGSEAAL